MVDARRFLLNSDFPLDKIVGFQSGTINAVNGTLVTTDIAHGFAFTPLPVGSWSYNAAFDDSYPPVVDFNGNGARPSVTIQANGSILRVNVDNHTGSDKTIYWRVFFLLPAGVSANLTPTASVSTRKLFDSTHNYTKLLKEGYETSAATIPHDLGYRPQVALWIQRTTGFVEMLTTADATASPVDTWAEVTTSSLILSPVSLSGIHYKVYADE